MKLTENVRKVIAGNVKRLREAKGLSAPDAAEAVGVHRSWWNLLEAGTLNFTIEKLERVAVTLEVDVHNLLENPVTVFAQGEAPKASKRRRSTHE